MTITPIDFHPDLAGLSGPLVPLAWVLEALAQVDADAADYQTRTNDLWRGSNERLVDIHAGGMREAGDFIRDRIAHRFDPAAYEAEEARRCTAWNKGMETGR